ncbi:competence protein [Virgibacillus phasianinus]|uniref:Competence protein n=1 Tax=Virgibacillus phasianinus TaxID=2017483 RepID=A0A220U200_9BACI|nr:competence protein ComK [Virgibacillus phasianinus]ASK62120.1 competence protein [Virgibacillus phasianinus]
MKKLKLGLTVISQTTKAIIRNDSKIHPSLIMEETGEFRSIHKPEQILIKNCLMYGSSLHGRQTAAKQILKVNSKVPVVLSPELGLFLIPTSSTKGKDCVWLAYHHIDKYESCGDKKTYVTFKDGTGIYVNATVSTLDMQYKRTSQLIVHQRKSSLFGPPSHPDTDHNPN